MIKPIIELFKTVFGITGLNKNMVNRKHTQIYCNNSQVVCAS